MTKSHLLKVVGLRISVLTELSIQIIKHKIFEKIEELYQKGFKTRFLIILDKGSSYLIQFVDHRTSTIMIFIIIICQYLMIYKNNPLNLSQNN